MRHTPRRIRYRSAIRRAHSRAPVAIAAADPLEGYGERELAVFVEAAEFVMAARIPKPDAEVALRWARPIRRELAHLARDVDKVLDRFERQSVARAVWALLHKGTGDFDVPEDVWRRFEEGMADVLSEMADEVAQTAWIAAAAALDVQMDYGISGDLFDPIDDVVGHKVRQIAESSRVQLADAVDTAVGRGYSVEQLVRGVSSDGFTGLRGMVNAWQAANPVRTTTDRATLIALTETANFHNKGTLDAYRASTMVEMVNVFDGASCGWETHTSPDLANGSRRTLADANAHPISHPHCQRAFGAVVKGAPPVGAPGAQTVRTPQVGPRPTSSELELRARAIQARAFSQASGAEASVTPLLRGVTGRTGGRLEGLDFRLKANGDRTIEKIMGDVLAGDPLEEARKVKDALRYTVILSERDTYKGAKAIADALEGQGVTAIKWKDNWSNPLSHDINTAWRTPDGTRFELQIHTPTSFERKMSGAPGHRASHAIYEELRALAPDDPGRAELERELRALWADVPVPPGVPFKPSIDPDLRP